MPLTRTLLTQINFFIFVRIVHLLVAKLRARQMHHTDYKFRWVPQRLASGELETLRARGQLGVGTPSSTWMVRAEGGSGG